MPEVDAAGMDPHVHRKRLQVAVRRARIHAGRTQAEVAAALDWSLSKLVRIESGAVRVSTTDLRALLSYYGIDDADRVDQLLAEARGARRPAWWAEYETLFGPQFTAYLGFESSATQVRQFQASLVPGLLQTERYSRAVLSAVQEPASIERLVEGRQKRQRLLEHGEPPEVSFVLDEAAIRRRIGGPVVMLEQLRHLQAVSRRPNVSLRLLTFDAGEHPGLAGSFVLLTVGDEQVVYVEDADGGMLQRDDVAVTESYAERFRRLEEIAGPIEPMLSRTVQEMRDGAGSEGLVR